jgi:hypothetical protein
MITCIHTAPFQVASNGLISQTKELRPTEVHPSPQHPNLSGIMHRLFYLPHVKAHLTPQRKPRVKHNLVQLAHERALGEKCMSTAITVLCRGAAVLGPLTATGSTHACGKWATVLCLAELLVIMALAVMRLDRYYLFSFH